MHISKKHIIYFFIFCFISITLTLSIHKQFAIAQVVAQSNNITDPVAYATTNTAAEELRRKIEQQTQNIEALNREIQTFSELKNKTSKEALTLQSLIRDLDQNAKVLNLDIKKTTNQISKANLEINSIDQNIETSEETIVDLRKVLSDNLKSIEQKEKISFIHAILAKDNISDSLTEINDRMNFNKGIHSQVTFIRKEKESLSISKHDKELKKTELSQFQNQLTDKKNVVEYNKNERSKTLKDTKNQENTYQKLLTEKQAAKATFEKELFSFESALKYTLDPTSIPRSGSAVLSWPLDNVRITQRFGKTVAAKRLYVSGSHNGVDFGTSIGTPIKSVLSGTVIGAGDTDLTCKGASFGRWILVKHLNGLASIYAHLSVISVKEGDEVVTGEIIGYSGNTGYSTGPHLHLGLYASNAVVVQNRPSISCGGKVYRMPIAPIDAYLDPMVYLPVL